MGELQNSSAMAVSTGSGEASVSSSGGRTPKKKRNLPGMPDPEAEVIALSPKTLLATNRFVCEICQKGFQRDQNLQLHRRGHNLPWKLQQRTTGKEIRKRVYVCPVPSCVHHDPTRALGDLTGIKKHFCRKHGEKKWKCERCSKTYAVKSDWKAHMKTCGTREYKCVCGNAFSRRDSFFTHRAFCDALAEETARAGAGAATEPPPPPQPLAPAQSSIFQPAAAPSEGTASLSLSSALYLSNNGSSILTGPVISATALLQKAAQMGAAAASSPSLFRGLGFAVSPSVGQHPNVKSESNSMSIAGIGLGLPLISSSPQLEKKPTTLDFLGLGMGDGGTSSRGLSALLNSFGGGSGVEAASTTTSYGGAGGSWNRETWEGAAERKAHG